jgi:hypothetical protein
MSFYREATGMRTSISVLILAIAAAQCAAKTITVDDDGPADFNNIQDAIYAADWGGTVVVYPGRYTGQGNHDIELFWWPVTVRSIDPNDLEIVAATIIDCNRQGRGFHFRDNEDGNSVLAGLTITNGYSHDGGGILCYHSSPTIINCNIVYNQAQNNGGGMCNEQGSNPTLVNCVFRGNVSWGYRCRLGRSGGGGMCNYKESSPKLYNCTFIDNHSGCSGGGVCNTTLRGPGSNAVLIECTFSGNSAELTGGGISNYRSEVSLADCRFTGNSAGRDGGGIQNGLGAIELTDCIFAENHTDEWGGGMATSSCDVELNNCIFKANSANWAGGGIAARYCSNANLVNCIFSENTANEHGGGLVGDGGDANLVNCTFVGNAAPGGNAVACTDSSSSLQLANCILWDGGNEIWSYSSAVDVTYSDVQGGWRDEGNIDADPCFAFTTDWHLMPDSPCIDSGTNTPGPGLPTADLDGNPRPLDGDSDSNSVADMGAYEYNPDAPSIAVSARKLQYVKNHGPSIQNLQIRNCGPGTLDWQIVKDCNWVLASPADGVSSGDVNSVSLTVDSTGLSGPAFHNCVLKVTDPDAANNPVAVEVSLYVPGPRHVPSEYDTIQAAIDAAENWDTVIVAPGTYTGDGNRDLDFAGKRITVRSIDPNDPNIVAATIIDCNGALEDYHTGFYFHNGEDANSVVDGLTITNSFGPDWPWPDLPPWWPPQWPPWMDELPEWPDWMREVPDPVYYAYEAPAASSYQESDGNYVSTEIPPEQPHGSAIYCGTSGFPPVPGPGPTIKNCIIAGNQGSAIFGSSGPVINCTIADNGPAWFGGGLSSCAGPVVNCTIRNNVARVGGGLSDCDSLVSNCMIIGNTARVGGGIANHYGRVINCTIADNRAGYYGGGMGFADRYPFDEPLPWETWWHTGAASIASDDLNSPPQVINCVIWGNHADANSGMYGYAAAYCDIQEGWPGEGNINSDPCFIAHGYWALVTDPNVQVEPNDPNAVWVDGDYHLLRTSPCIDAGDNNSIAADVGDLDGDANTAEPTPFDFEGRPRIIDGIPDGIPIVDMGVYETVTKPHTHYVDGDANGADNGSSWEDAFKYLQDAPAAAIYGDQIWVAEGLYKPDESRAHPDGTGERTATFQLKNAVTIRGGYAGAQAPDPNARDFNLYETVLSGDLNGDDGPGFENNADNSYHVVSANSVGQQTALEGLTITAGNCNDRRAGYYQGGGIYNLNASPTVLNCRLAGNWAWAGAGAANIGGKAAFINCSFNGNAASGGGGLFNKSGAVSLINCIFVGNSAAGGGGLSSSGQTMSTVTNCIFRANRNTSSGTMDEPDQILATSVSVNYCCVQGWTGGLAGVGNTGQDPCFVEPGYWDSNGLWVDGDYHLSSDSPCIDAGDPCYTGGPDETDLDGRPRVINGCVDMGAYELQLPPLEAHFWLLPGVINRCGRLPKVMAWVLLPRGITEDQVDADQPLVLYPGQVQAVRQYVIELRFLWRKRTNIFAFFDKDELMDAIADNGRVRLQVLGTLVSRQQFGGTDTVWISARTCKYLAAFASYWLRADCGAPDWCGGFDLDHDGMVNFADFSKLGRSETEIFAP